MTQRNSFTTKHKKISCIFCFCLLSFLHCKSEPDPVLNKMERQVLSPEVTAFNVFNAKLMSDRKEYPNYVQYNIDEYNLLITVPGKAIVILDNSLYKGKEEINDAPQLLKSAIEQENKNGVIFQTIDALTYIPYQNRAFLFKQFEIVNMKNSTRIVNLTKENEIDVSEIINEINNHKGIACVYDSFYKNENGIFFVKFTFKTKEGVYYLFYTICNKKELLISFLSTNNDIEKKILDSIKYR